MLSCRRIRNDRESSRPTCPERVQHQTLVVHTSSHLSPFDGLVPDEGLGDNYRWGYLQLRRESLESLGRGRGLRTGGSLLVP
jgi:hypothetical protein